MILEDLSPWRFTVEYKKRKWLYFAKIYVIVVALCLSAKPSIYDDCLIFLVTIIS